MKIYCISDLHVKGSEDDLGVQNAIVRLAKKAEPTDWIIVAGDLVDDGSQVRQWYALDKILAPIREANINFFAVPGNHDTCGDGIRGFGFSEKAWNAFSKRFIRNSERNGKPWEQIRIRPVDEELNIVGLCSVTKGHAYFSCGEIGTRQLERLEGYLLPIRKKSIIVLHHHLYDENPFEELIDASRLENILSRNIGEVACVVFGHRHRQKRYVLKRADIEVPVFSLPAQVDQGQVLVLDKVANGLLPSWGVF